jgi:hypothetical protein
MVVFGVGTTILFIYLCNDLIEIQKLCEKNPSTAPIYSLETSKNLEGDIGFVLGIGGGDISEETYYYTYIGTSRGMHLTKLDTDYTYIKETTKSPYIAYCGSLDGMETKTLYVPSGTIRREFNGMVNG